MIRRESASFRSGYRVPPPDSAVTAAVTAAWFSPAAAAGFSPAVAAAAQRHANGGEQRRIRHRLLQNGDLTRHPAPYVGNHAWVSTHENDRELDAPLLQGPQHLHPILVRQTDIEQ
jgi:hypothetical protein